MPGTTRPLPSHEPLRYRLLDLALEHRLLPDPVLRAGSWYGTLARERRESRGGVEEQEARLAQLLARMSSGPIAEVPEKANQQHYELPADFLGLILGPRRKYSGCLWDAGVSSLAGAEERMLSVSCERARVRDGQRILDLGCGWGSLSLWLAEHYPHAEVVGVSNSRSQRTYIERRAEEAGLSNLTIVTADVYEFEPSGQFDRVMSIEMFEHMRNWRELLRRVRGWLRADGKAFIHVFSHRTLPYLFESTWAAERFFTAGLMPSHELMLHFQDDLRVTSRWSVAGSHYARTLEAWLERLDARAEEALAILQSDGRSRAQAKRLLGSWRLFLISTAVIWSYHGGQRWMVSQYLLEPR